jgi:hypothetical protein
LVKLRSNSLSWAGVNRVLCLFCFTDDDDVDEAVVLDETP